MVKMESHPLAAGTFRTWRWPAYTEASSASQEAGKSTRDENGESIFQKDHVQTKGWHHDPIWLHRIV